jgi:hypothetical protein
MSTSKPNETLLQIYGGVAAVFILFAGVFPNIHATPVPVVVGACFAAVLFIGLALREWLRVNRADSRLLHNGVLVAVLILGLIGCRVVWMLELKEKRQSDTPSVFPNRIHLATDEQTIRNAVTISNPGDRPVYDVMLRLAVSPIGVPAASVLTELDSAPATQTNFNDIPFNFLRTDARSATNTHTDIVYFTVRYIPAKSERQLRIAGTLKTNSWADLSIAESKPNLAITDWQSNVIKIGIESNSAIWRDASWIEFSKTNIPFGGIIFKNGKAVYTNLPHLMLSVDALDSKGTNQFELTNDFIFRTNNNMSPSDMTNLLVIPSDVTTSPMLKLWLINDSDIGVTNINIVVTSMAGCPFVTNEFWHESVASPNNTPNRFVFNVDSLPVDRGVRIPPISFASNGGVASLIGICANATNMQQQIVSFWLTFIPSNNVSKPFFSRVITSVTIANNTSSLSLTVLPTMESSKQSLSHPKNGIPDEEFALILLISIVALVVMSIILYAIRS